MFDATSPGRIACSLVAAFALVSTAARAENAAFLEVDPTVSTLTTILCVQGECSEDTHPVVGEIVLTLDCGEPPTQAAVRDFRLAATTNHVAFLDFGFGGKVNALVADLGIRRHDAASIPVPVPLSPTNVVFRKLTNDLAGTIDYRASGLACALLQIAGLKCEDRIDLGSRPPNVVDELPATWTLEDGVLRISGTFSFREDIDTEHPEIGYVGGRAKLSASGRLRPLLHMHPSSDRLEFRWCQAFPSARLEVSSALTGEPWLPHSATPEASGTEWTVRVPEPTAATFYRLRVDP